MHLCLYGIALTALSLPVAAGDDYGYWNVSVSRGWPASGYRYWNLEANYSGTPGLTKHSSWNYSPVNGSTITIHNDPNFDATFSDDSKVTILQSVSVSETVAFDVIGNGKIDCKINPASGRACSGSTRIDATLK
ncbi:hypothetical protein O1611_g1552 [Lasiodiplodia mahajangana]|uniref:Uncharacterized protein n=1 Tax=Lasiodiplodia mahajangana TaxID=1108764 RepID=A0ACC2JXP8_9PEZI|nr:hypothetical protein O1611_g1552 [Lasiodiplodia mahajangana]